MHMEAFDLLREADDERWRTVPETRPDPDPRFMRERAAQIFAWHVRRQRKLDQAEWRNSKPPPLDQAFEYSEQALALVGADKLLRAHLLNNLCFQHLSEGRLEQAQSYGLEPNRREWPPAILDTIHQLRLAEGDGLTLDEIRDIEADYRAINLSTLEFDHREEITQRIAEIQELLATRRAHAPVG
jgi:hypothetical protein